MTALQARICSRRHQLTGADANCHAGGLARPEGLTAGMHDFQLRWNSGGRCRHPVGAVAMCSRLSAVTESRDLCVDLTQHACEDLERQPGVRPRSACSSADEPLLDPLEELDRVA